MSRVCEDYGANEFPSPELPPCYGKQKREQPGFQPMLRAELETPETPPSTQEESELLDARAFGHRATGKTYRQIAQMLNIPSSSAYKRVQREMGRRREEFAEDEADARELIVALLDGALEAIATQAYVGDQKAFHLLLQYANTRVRLAKIENPKAQDKMNRKLNAAAAAAQQVGEGFKGAKSEQGVDWCDCEQDCVHGCEQDRGQKCEQESQPLAERQVAAHEKIAAKHLDADDERLAQPAQSTVHAAPHEPADSHPAESGQDCEQDRGQKCGQESQLLAETQVAADEKMCAKHLDTDREDVKESAAIESEATGSENTHGEITNTRVTPTGISWGTLGCGGTTWENQGVQPP